MDTRVIDTAAQDATTAARQMLQMDLDRHPSCAEIACALAKAFGAALAEAEASTDSAHLVEGIRGLAEDAYREALATIATQDCGGPV